MKEFVKKLIERLEEEKKTAYELRGKPHMNYGTLCGWISATDKAIKIINQLAEEYNNGWIPCSTDMPDHNQEVFIKFPDGGICNGRFWIAEGTNYCGFNTKFGLFIAEQVAEWKPYKPED